MFLRKIVKRTTLRCARLSVPYTTTLLPHSFFRKLQFFFEKKRKHEFTIMLTSVFEVEPKEHQFHDRQELSEAAGFQHLRNRILRHLTAAAGRGGMAPVMMPAHRQNSFFFGSYTSAVPLNTTRGSKALFIVWE